MLNKNGIPTLEDLQQVTPPQERLNKGPVAIAECFQCIPCNPCSTACPVHAITVQPDINQTPVIDWDRCIGCKQCVAACPGLAIFVVDMNYSDDLAAVTLPYEFLPVPEKGACVNGLSRAGAVLGQFEVVEARQAPGNNLTWLITLAVPKDLAMDVRNIRVGGAAHE